MSVSAPAKLPTATFAVGAQLVGCAATAGATAAPAAIESSWMLFSSRSVTTQRSAKSRFIFLLRKRNKKMGCGTGPLAEKGWFMALNEVRRRFNRT